MILPDFLWVCNFDYSCIWVIDGDVWAVNVNIKFALLDLRRIWVIKEVLPVPVGAVKNIGSKFAMKHYIIEE